MDSGMAFTIAMGVVFILMMGGITVVTFLEIRKSVRKRREKTRIFSNPMPPKAKMVVLDALEALVKLRWQRFSYDQDREISNHLAAIAEDTRRYYTALNGRPDINAFFVELEQFVKGTCADYARLGADSRYANKKDLERCRKEIEAFATRTYRLTERLVSEELASVHGRLELREGAESTEREFEQLMVESRTPFKRLVDRIQNRRR